MKTAGTVVSLRAAAAGAAERLDKATAAHGWYGKSTKPEKSLLLLPWLLRDSSGERPDADDKPYMAAAAA